VKRIVNPNVTRGPNIKNQEYQYRSKNDTGGKVAAEGAKRGGNLGGPVVLSGGLEGLPFTIVRLRGAVLGEELSPNGGGV